MHSFDPNLEESALTVKHLCKILNLHRVTIYRLRETDKNFPRGFCVGKSRRWLKSEILGWLHARSAAAAGKK